MESQIHSHDCWYLVLPLAEVNRGNQGYHLRSKLPFAKKPKVGTLLDCYSMEDIISRIRLFYMAYKKDSVAEIKVSNQLTLLLKREMLLNGPKLLK